MTVYCHLEHFSTTFRKFQEYINPKSITLEQLFGEFDKNSNEWIDGVISTLFRCFANDEENENKWASEKNLSIALDVVDYQS